MSEMSGYGYDSKTASGGSHGEMQGFVEGPLSSFAFCSSRESIPFSDYGFCFYTRLAT